MDGCPAAWFETRVEQSSSVTSQNRSPTVRAAAALLRVRWFVRAPIWLFRSRLGFVFGTRLLMLEHTGRTSGLRRYVVLEVVDHPAPRRYVVVSGFGARAQWFRNVQANREVRVYVGARGPAAASAIRLDPAMPSRIPGPGRSYDRFSNRRWARASMSTAPICP
jgi:deazaflavin-dependent oxidoreductase (nitroreductase family)